MQQPISRASNRGWAWAEHLRAYYELCKPRVVFLIVFTAIVGMLLSTPGLLPLDAFLFGTLGIALASASAAAFNHVAEEHVDARMARTRGRPLPTGYIGNKKALTFAFILAALAMGILVRLVNPLTAVLTFSSLIGYAVIYTLYLKHATPQNIVIGGAAGAAPPVLGWTAITGEIHAHALLLFLIIFVWTPPHFWALAIHRYRDYTEVDIPMLPVTHGVEYTRLQVLLYTILLVAVSLLPFAVKMSGPVYLLGALVLGGIFLYYAIAMKIRKEDRRLPMKTFGYSITYLILLFSLLLVDHYVPLMFYHLT